MIDSSCPAPDAPRCYAVTFILDRGCAINRVTEGGKEIPFDTGSNVVTITLSRGIHALEISMRNKEIRKFVSVLSDQSILLPCDWE